MGTSKGYILPTKKNWTDAKRAATQLSKENNLNNRIKLASKYANAMKEDSIRNSSESIKSIAKIIGLSQSVASKGAEQTLRDLNKWVWQSLGHSKIGVYGLGYINQNGCYVYVENKDPSEQTIGLAFTICITEIYD